MKKNTRFAMAIMIAMTMTSSMLIGCGSNTAAGENAAEAEAPSRDEMPTPESTNGKDILMCIRNFQGYSSYEEWYDACKDCYLGDMDNSTDVDLMAVGGSWGGFNNETGYSEDPVGQINAIDWAYLYYKHTGTDITVEEFANTDHPEFASPEALEAWIEEASKSND